jgi:hypothetical protein
MRKVVVRYLALAIAIAAFDWPWHGVAGAKKLPPPTGALAYHRDSGSFGYAVNAADSRSARIAALNQCGNPKCEVVMSLSKDCGAVANGPKRFVASRGATRQEAETRALRQCGDHCQIVGWACPR